MPPRQKKESYGGGRISRVLPSVTKGDPLPAVLNVNLTLQEALMLNLAIDECVRELNSRDLRTKAGKAGGVNLAVKLDLGRIDVVEGKTWYPRRVSATEPYSLRC